MSIFIVDVEADGQCPGINNMVWIGAVKVDSKLDQTFEGKLKPMYPKCDTSDDALAVSGLKYEDTLEFPDPKETILEFFQWIQTVSKGRPILYSDNNGFDFGYINYYFWYHLNQNPFGWTSRNINSMWHGIQKDCYSSFKFLRKTKHTHNPVDDAMGNAEALWAMKEKYGLKINLK